MVRSWKWFWLWLVISAIIGLAVRLFGGAFGIYGWIAAAMVIVALAPIMGRIEYKITGREYPRRDKLS
jgi:hypothetical protein